MPPIYGYFAKEQRGRAYPILMISAKLNAEVKRQLGSPPNLYDADS